MKTKFGIRELMKTISRFYPLYLMGHTVILFIGLDLIKGRFWNNAMSYLSSCPSLSKREINYVTRIIQSLYWDILNFMGKAIDYSFLMFTCSLFIMTISSVCRYRTYHKNRELIIGIACYIVFAMIISMPILANAYK